jgi:hypothetical protein
MTVTATVPMLPATGRPKLPAAEAQAIIAAHGVDRAAHPIVVLGVRGYYRDTMGAVGANDRCLYDDCLAIDTPRGFLAVNGNCDPSKFEPGIATLLPGVYFAHEFGLHKGAYLALVQTGGEVTVSRDGQTAHDEGWFGINIHRGGYATTGSLGCQTVHPDQWAEFIGLGESEARRLWGASWQRVVVPYVLVDGPVR